MPPRQNNKLSRLSILSAEDIPAINVLLVEDSKTVRTQLRQCIAQLENVNLIEAGTLAEARAILETRAPSLFCTILDLTLPDAAGVDTVDAVRAYDVPIIVLTGSVDPSLRQAILDRHVIDYMLKGDSASIEDVAYLIGRLRQNHTMKVMVVDDSATFRLHISNLLAQYRFSVLTANNGRDALKLLELNPDTALILTDYHMPEMNGLELVRRIRRHHRREDLAIIALSSSDHPDLSTAMLKTGANDYLDKNFQREEFYCRVVQNTNMVRFVRELQDMSNRDYLTRLHNRRYLFQSALAVYAPAREGKYRLATAMLDADHFKQINDQYGHPAGDEALKKIARAIRKIIPASEIVARYGGEEFTCVVRIDSQGEAQELFERLRAEIEAIHFQCNGQRIPVTASIGVTTRLGHSFADMIEYADQALLRAKEEGRNRVMVFSNDRQDF